MYILILKIKENSTLIMFIKLFSVIYVPVRPKADISDGIGFVVVSSLRLSVSALSIL